MCVSILPAFTYLQGTCDPTATLGRGKGSGGTGGDGENGGGELHAFCCLLLIVRQMHPEGFFPTQRTQPVS